MLDSKLHARLIQMTVLLTLGASFSSSISGCALFEIAKQQERIGQIVRIRGDVSANTNSNLRYDSKEPLIRPMGQPTHVLSWGDSIDGIELMIEPGSGVTMPTSFDVAEAADQTAAREHVVTMRALIVRGEVASLDDPRFTPENGSKGLWRPVDFMEDVRPGVFFLQEYRDDRIPILFVHGVGGHPGEFSFLIEQLDQSRFQPWVFFYPSGLSLHGIGSALASLITDLQLRRGFDQIGVVGHSMGGLVSRSFILQLEEMRRHDLVPLFISISTPFGGYAAAQAGADRIGNLPSGVSIPASFLDMAPKSEFFRDLFYVSEEFGIPCLLPPGMSHHLIFGYKRQNLRAGSSSDGTIDLASQLRVEAQAQA